MSHTGEDAIDHVVLTRFNLPTRGVESLVRAREGWLRERIALFERYTVPSIRAQTRPGLTWLVFLDPESPQWLRERIEHHAEAGVLRPLYRTEVTWQSAVEDIRATVARTGDVLVTTNLDNDDGLADDFAARVCSAPTPHPRTALFLTRGLITGDHGLYLNIDPHNAFCSVREPWADPVTCWADWHNLLPRRMPAIELDGGPGWLQVVHGGNVSNRVRGRRVSPSPYLGGFRGLDDLPVPTRLEILADRYGAQPRRLARERARAAAKATALRVLGKSGLDRAKWLLASHRRSRLG